MVVHTATLSDGNTVPVLAIGTALIDVAKIEGVVTDALKCGYRHIDTAFIYGNQQAIGKALSVNTTLKRDELFLTWKLWSTYHRKDLALKSIEQALSDLQVDYLDLCMIHNPMTMKEGFAGVPFEDGNLVFGQSTFLDAWKGLEEAVDMGLVKSIGLSNFNARQIEMILKKGNIKPAVNQVECHPYLNQSQLLSYCQKNEIILSAYGALGSPGTPAEYIQPGRKVLDDPVVKDIAGRYGRTPAQVLLRYQLERGNIVVVKTQSRSRLVENRDCLDFKMKAQFVAAIDKLDAGERHFTFRGMGETHPEYPFNEAF